MRRYGVVLSFVVMHRLRLGLGFRRHILLLLLLLLLLTVAALRRPLLVVVVALACSTATVQRLLVVGRCQRSATLHVREVID